MCADELDQSSRILSKRAQRIEFPHNLNIPEIGIRLLLSVANTLLKQWLNSVLRPVAREPPLPASHKLN
jgi:hypothetical protein